MASQEYQIFKEEIKQRMLKMDIPGGQFTKREMAIIAIVWNNHDDIHSSIFQQMTNKAVNESGGCSSCGDLNGHSCTCENDDDELDECQSCGDTSYTSIIGGFCYFCREGGHSS